VELKGSLKNFPLPDIIQLIGMGRRSGVLAVTSDEDDKASIYFDGGEMIHAEYGALEGAQVIYQLFKKQDGSFQFASGESSPKRSIHADWMSIIMEAARRYDEQGNRAGGDLGDLSDLMDETDDADAGGVTIDLAETKTKMIAVLENRFGRKSKKLQEELEKVDADGEKLLEFCNKAEKYIFVFIDNKKAKDVVEEMRNLIRIDRFA
jgi:hypothetical protein